MLAFFQNKALLPTAIRALADDHARYLLGKGPNASELERAPIVRDWRIARTDSRRLDGVLEADGRHLEDNNSLIWTINLQDGWARTTDGLYRLKDSQQKSEYDLEENKIYNIGNALLVHYY